MEIIAYVCHLGLAMGGFFLLANNGKELKGDSSP